MNTKSFKVVFALSFSILCGILFGKNISHFIGIPLGWILGCVTTLITGLLFYKPAEVVKYMKEACTNTCAWVESRKTRQASAEFIRKKRIRKARYLAIMANIPHTISTIFDRMLFCTSWLLLCFIFLYEDIFILVSIASVLISLTGCFNTFSKILTMKPDYERGFRGFTFMGFFDRSIKRSFSRMLGKNRGWYFPTITKKGNPISVAFKLLYIAYENRMEIILGTGIFLLEMFKKLNSHERIVIAVFGVTFCLVGLIVDALSPNNFVGPLTGLIGGTILGAIEQIFYNHISPKIDTWIDDMRTSRFLLES